MKGQGGYGWVTECFLFFLQDHVDSFLSAGHPARFPWIIPSFITSIDFICTIHSSSDPSNWQIHQTGRPSDHIAFLVHYCFPRRRLNFLFDIYFYPECQTTIVFLFPTGGPCVNLGRFRAELALIATEPSRRYVSTQFCSQTFRNCTFDAGIPSHTHTHVHSSPGRMCCELEPPSQLRLTLVTIFGRHRRCRFVQNLATVTNPAIWSERLGLLFKASFLLLNLFLRRRSEWLGCLSGVRSQGVGVRKGVMPFPPPSLEPFPRYRVLRPRKPLHLTRPFTG